MQSEFDELLAAIVNGDTARAKQLLKKTPELANKRAKTAHLNLTINHWIYVNDTALHVAAAGYRVEIAKLLLDAGADLDAAFNHRRSWPLHYAADGYIISDSWDEKKQVAMIRLLLKKGADIDAQDKNGATPLHRAVRTRCAGAVKCLLDAGAEARIKNKPGSTPFHLAVQNTGRGGSGADKAKTAQREIIEVFLGRGIGPKLRDAKGRSVLDWARSDSIREMFTTPPRRGS